jgi:hypothetical protein
MKHYNEKELDTKIHTFLSKKLQKYPELGDAKQATHTITAPSFSTKLLQSLTSINPLAIH